MTKKVFLYIILALTLVMSVNAVSGILTIVEPRIEITESPGVPTNTSQYFTLRNTDIVTLPGIIVNSTALSGGALGSIPASAVAFVPSAPSVPANSTFPIATVVTVPALQRAGTYRGTITAFYSIGNSDNATLDVIVREVPGFTATATSPTIAKGMTGYITVNVTNTGNADIPDLTYTVSPTFTSTAGTISYSSLTPHPFLVSYGSSRLMSIGFSPASSQPAGVYSGQIAMSYGGANVTLPLTLTVRDPVYSLSMPDVIYPASERNVNVTQTVTITNNGDYTLTGILPLNTTAAKTWITGATPATLGVGSSFTVTLTSTVAEDADSRTKQIGTLVFTSSQLNRTSAIKTNAVSKLAFDSVKVSLEDGSWKSINNGATFGDDAKPGDSFGVKVKLENLYTDDEDIDMEVDVTALFKGAGTDGEDIDGDSDTVDIKAGDKSSEIEVTFDEDTIDWEASSGKLVMELTATGDDDNGATHTVMYNFSINVKRSTSGEIVFTRFETTSTVNCGNSFILYADGRSVGEDSEDEVVLKIKNDNLGIAIEEKFSMGAYDGDEDCDAIDEGEDSSCREFSYSKSIQVPAGMAAGTYTIEGKLYINDGGKQTDEDTFDLNVQCRSSTSTTEEEETQTTGTTGTTTTTTTTQRPTTTTTTTQRPTTTTPGATTSTVDVMYGGGRTSTTRGVSASMPTRITDTTRQKGFSDSNGYVALLSIVSVLLIIGIIVLLVYAFSRPGNAE